VSLRPNKKWRIKAKSSSFLINSISPSAATFMGEFYTDARKSNFSSKKAVKKIFSYFLGECVVTIKYEWLPFSAYESYLQNT